MKAYLRAFDLWEVVETGTDPPPLRENPTIAQIHQHSEESAKKYKALSAIHSSISETIFTRIMNCETAKQAWDPLKEEFQGSERTRQIQVLNLWREFEILRMTENKTVQEYIDRLMQVVNKLRLLGEELLDKRIVSKVLVSVLERFERKISSLEDSKDLSTLTLSEVVNVFQAIEQRRTLRQKDQTEGALMAKQMENLASSSSERKRCGFYQPYFRKHLRSKPLFHKETKQADTKLINRRLPAASLVVSGMEK